MQVKELAKELGASVELIYSIIKRQNVPYIMIDTDNKYYRAKRVKDLPPASVDFIREYIQNDLRMNRDHGYTSPVMDDFFKCLVNIRRKAGQPIDVDRFIAIYRDLDRGF